MRRKTEIINSESDAKKAGMTFEDALTQATITVRHDKANYPPEYNKDLKPGEDGYIEPIYEYEEIIDEAVMKRLGFKNNKLADESIS